MDFTWLMDCFPKWTFIAASVILSILITKFLSRRKMPPGPFGLPIVGYLPFLGKKPHLKLQEVGKKYGDMFSIKLGSYDVIVLNSSKRMRDVLSKPEVTGRPESTIFQTVDIDSPFFSSGDHWIEHRRFSLHVLRDLGLGKSALHSHIMDEIDHIVKTIQSYNGEPCNVTELLTPSMSNNICSLIFGKRYEYNDPERKYMDKTLDTAVKFLNQTSPTIFFPWIMKLPFVQRLMNYTIYTQTMKNFKDFVNRKIEEHRISLDSNNQRDFIDSYLTELKLKQERNQSTTLSESYLIGSVMNFFGAGSETVRTTISWILYTMAAYPEVQKRVQNELDSVVGAEKSPSFSDTKCLPYTFSVLTEVMRWQTTVPFSLVRRVVHDVQIDGYLIPRGTLVLPNLWAAHHNPSDWENPDEFNPDRFLSSDGKTFVKSENFLPFSYGKRACPGEGLAIVEVFLYFSNILQKFSIELPKGAVPCFEGDLGISYHLKSQELCLKPR